MRIRQFATRNIVECPLGIDKVSIDWVKPDVPKIVFVDKNEIVVDGPVTLEYDWQYGVAVVL